MDNVRILSGANILLYSCDFGDGITIGFNNGRNFIQMGMGDYTILPFSSPMLRIVCELIPCTRNSLQVGDTAYCSSAKVPDSDYLSNYCKILSENSILYIREEGRLHECSANLSSFSWYKVVPVKNNYS
ncbi:hypothetical protein G7050_00305 [Dysgonomonas sp. HDW5A]|uniref:hypothetical protein n=1 Tax=Dysgonomonas sp. HDW5A TaxID=2714926 RepID=UPI00140C6A92|nr:hypothetical protein [Dysgonomonas sp. HDW5A]QIK58358.1 hypothetical protein G7050_00305 [Dysgonomonas sp. HDW5A]